MIIVYAQTEQSKEEELDNFYNSPENNQILCKS